MTKKRDDLDFLKYQRPDTFEAIRRSERYQRLSAWWDEHGEPFQEAIGMWGPKDVIILALLQLPEFVNDSFPMAKHHEAMVADRVLRAFMSGNECDTDDLRAAVVGLAHRFNAATDRLANVERALIALRNRPPRMIGPRRSALR